MFQYDPTSKMPSASEIDKIKLDVGGTMNLDQTKMDEPFVKLEGSFGSRGALSNSTQRGATITNTTRTKFPTLRERLKVLLGKTIIIKTRIGIMESQATIVSSQVSRVTIE